MERKKTVLLCVTGGIAAYKIATLASMLVKTGYDVKEVSEKAKKEPRSSYGQWLPRP